MKKENNKHKKENTAMPEVDTTEAEAFEGELVDEKEEGAAMLLAEKEKQNAELLDRLQRTLADYDNFRKRTIKEKAAMYDDGVGSTVEKLLPVVDNFERAMAASDDKESSLYKGVEMILRQLYGLLDELGVEAIAALGETFDHNLHFAVAHEEDESKAENEITYEMQKGYKFKDRVIRASMVKVAN